MSYAQLRDSSRLTGLVIVVVLHVLLVYGFISIPGPKIDPVANEPLETKIIEEVKPPPDKPPPPKLAPPNIPPPEVQLQLPAALRQNTITTVTSTKPPPPPAQPHVPNRSAAIINAGACQKPDYPPAALRAQEEGLVTLAFLIDVDGTVLESKVERSSGSRRLDEAAKSALGLCKFQAAQVDGEPEKSWARIEYQWRIE